MFFYLFFNCPGSHCFHFIQCIGRYFMDISWVFHDLLWHFTTFHDIYMTFRGVELGFSFHKTLAISWLAIYHKHPTLTLQLNIIHSLRSIKLINPFNSIYLGPLIQFNSSMQIPCVGAQSNNHNIKAELYYATQKTASLNPPTQLSPAWPNISKTVRHKRTWYKIIIIIIIIIKIII